VVQTLAHQAACGPRTVFVLPANVSLSRILHKVIKALYYQDSPSKSHVTKVQVNMQLLRGNNIFLQFMTL